LWNDSVENKSRAYDVSPQTVRNYVEKQGTEVIEKLLENARKISLEVLKGVKEVDLINNKLLGQRILLSR
jgi:putative transposase